MAIMKTLTINGVTYRVAPAKRVESVTLFADAWVGANLKFSQVVNIPGVTPQSQVTLNISEDQLQIFRDKDIAFSTRNSNGIVTVCVVGEKPLNDYTMQVSITEVDV